MFYSIIVNILQTSDFFSWISYLSKGVMKKIILQNESCVE